MRKQVLHPRTATINQKQKTQSKKARQEALSWLVTMFPQAFDSEKCIRPLKIGIMDDILAYEKTALEAGISKSKLREAVVIFTRRIDYLACLKARELRIDLQGNTLDAVSEEEAEQANLKIKKRIEKTLKNARKTKEAVLAPTPHQAKTSSPQTEQTASYYPDRPPAFGQQHAPSSRTAPVMVTHKVTRAYDPSAVARLKEKLGLSRKNDA